MKKAATVAEYISGFPPPTQKLLKQLRAIIRQTVPDAEEGISYGMPYYSFHGRLAYFAGYARHIGLYAMPSAVAKFKKDIARYKSSKGTVQFPLDEPLPLKLIAGMIKFRAGENLGKAAEKSKAKKGK